MRKSQQKGSAGAAVLDAETEAEVRPGGAFRRPPADAVIPRREIVDEFSDDEDTEAFLRASGRNRRLRRGLIPKTRNGWIAAGVGVALVLAAVGVACYGALSFVTTSEIFRVTSSQQIELVNNNHLSRAQMLSVFGEDVDRNIFHVPLEQRRQQLEQMPWVERATVMRLLPNRLRVQVTERVPVAYLRQGGNIGLIDASGVVLDIPPDAAGNANYTFPVVTGIKATDEADSRRQRMALYSAFMKDMDSDGKGSTSQISEVDLSDPEDVKALIPYNNQEVLVHFGVQGFLTRFHAFQQHIAEWRTTYPRLSGVDMRYERQVVLQMPPKDSTVPGASDSTNAATATATVKPAAKPAAQPVKPVAAAVARTAPPAAKSVAKPATHEAPHSEVAHAVKPAAHETAHAAASHKAAEDAKQAATRKRVEAIKAWMAKREKARSGN